MKLHFFDNYGKMYNIERHLIVVTSPNIRKEGHFCIFRDFRGNIKKSFITATTLHNPIPNAKIIWNGYA